MATADSSTNCTKVQAGGVFQGGGADPPGSPTAENRDQMNFMNLWSASSLLSKGPASE